VCGRERENNAAAIPAGGLGVRVCERERKSERDIG